MSLDEGLSSTAPGPAALVLLVERADTRALYRDILRHAYTIDEASDGREALAKAITDPPALIVTGTQLTGLTGYQLCELLRADRDTSGIPIVMLTNDAGPAAIARAKAVGADTVLVKPCLPDVLMAEMTRLRERSLALRVRSTVLHATLDAGLRKSTAILARSARSKAGAYHRYATTHPPIAAPEPNCPECGAPLLYEGSHVGGVNEHHAEQWDDFECPQGCGDFRYRHHTRKLTKRW